MITFDPGLSTTKDQVRLRLGDTDSESAILQDETILAMLNQYPYDEACAQLAESCGISFGRQAELVAQGHVRYAYRLRAKHFFDLAKSIRDTAQPPPGSPINTGAVFGTMVAPDLSKYRTD